MKKKLISSILALTMAVGTILTGCGATVTTNITVDSGNEQQSADKASDDGKEAASADASAEATAADDKASADRPGAKWIDSGLFGAYEGVGEIRLEDDFAAYINRDWAETVKINEGESNASSRTEQIDRLNEAKLELLTGEKKDDNDLTSLQNLYQLILDWDTRNKNGLDELKPYAEDIMGVKSVDELTKLLADEKRNLYGAPMMEETIMANSEDAFSNILCISGPVMFGSSADDYAGADSGKEGDVISVVRSIAEYLLTRLDYSDSEAKELFDNALAFELNFVPGLDAFEQRAINEGMGAIFSAKFTEKELEDKFKNLPVAKLYKDRGYDLSKLTCIMMPEATEAFEEKYTDENLEQLKAWTLIHTIMGFSDYCDRETYETTTKLMAPITGTDSLKKDEVYALDTVGSLLPTLVDQAYVNYCFDKEIKPQVAELVDMMIDAYRDMLKEEDWMSEETQAAAIEKLDNIKLNICYPDNLPDVGSVTIKSTEDGGTLFEAVLEAKRYADKLKIDTQKRRNDGTYWASDIYYSTLGACYMPGENSINIFAGICGGDYYDPDWPIEKKLGGLCMVVGHEITHAFDNNGSTYDKDGNFKNWWTDEDRAAFQERVDKLLAYYSALVPAPQISDDPYGDRGAAMVQGEAIGDLGSVKCLLSIAKKQENFDYDMFFTQLATIQKNCRYEAAEQFYIATNEHPVECYRCNIPVQNYDEFIETYDIKEGDGMYLAPEDRITVW